MTGKLVNHLPGFLGCASTLYLQHQPDKQQWLKLTKSMKLNLHLYFYIFFLTVSWRFTSWQIINNWLSRLSTSDADLYWWRYYFSQGFGLELSFLEISYVAVSKQANNPHFWANKNQSYKIWCNVGADISRILSENWKSYKKVSVETSASELTPSFS